MDPDDHYPLDASWAEALLDIDWGDIWDSLPEVDVDDEGKS
jgi:hypothetical protein